MAKKRRRGSSVKASRRWNPTTWTDLQAKLARTEIDVTLPSRQYPNWHDALDRESGPNPVDADVERRLGAAGNVRTQLRQFIALQAQFTALLPESARAAWLELERLSLEVRVLRSIAHFNVGVDCGRDMQLISEAAQRAGVDTEGLERTTLFRLAYELARIVGELDSGRGAVHPSPRDRY